MSVNSKNQIRIAFLRAVNVGGTGKLAMSAFKQMCVEAGFESVQTYIASGNVCFRSSNQPEVDQSLIEKGLSTLLEKPSTCIVLDLPELSAIIDDCPFQAYPGNQHLAILLPGSTGAEVLKNIKGQSTELIQLGRKCIYVCYPDGIGKSKLKIPAAEHGTARNFNTLTKMRELALAIPT